MKTRNIATMMVLALPALLLAVGSDCVTAQIKPIQEMSVQSASVGGSKKFEELLENKDLSRFRGYQSEEIPAGWRIEGKNLVFDGKGSGDIITKDTYRDFELQVEWSIEKGGNSGIMFRVTLGDSYPFESGPEIQILDDEAAGDGKNELTSAGALYGLYPATTKKLNPVGKWNKSRIIVEANKITHYLNGVKVFEAISGSDDWNERVANSKFKDWKKFNQSEVGHIAFQNHGDPVKFREIRIKRLSDDSSTVTNADSAPGAAPGDAGAAEGLGAMEGLGGEAPRKVGGSRTKAGGLAGEDTKPGGEVPNKGGGRIR
jgi:hypothetical protein